MKTKVLAIIIAAGLLLGVGTGIGFAIYGNLPQNVAATAIFNAIDDFLYLKWKSSYVSIIKIL